MTVGTLGDPLNDAADHLPLVFEHILEHLVLLRITEPLEHHLLAYLRRQPGKILGRQGDIDEVTDGCLTEFRRFLKADFRRRILYRIHHPTAAEDRDLRRVWIDVYANALRWIAGASIGGGEGRFHKAQQRLLGD